MPKVSERQNEKIKKGMKKTEIERQPDQYENTKIESIIPSNEK